MEPPAYCHTSWHLPCHAESDAVRGAEVLEFDVSLDRPGGRSWKINID